MKVRSDVMKIMKNMHTWVGISAGILLFICFFAGGLSMFQHHLTRWATPHQQILTQIEPHQYQDLITKVQAEFPVTQKSFTLNLSSNEFHYAPISWNETNRAEGFNASQTAWIASLDQHGQLIAKKENLSKAGWLIEQLHETAGIPGLIGHHGLGVYVMGIVSILYFLALLSGLIILLPTLVKDYFVIRPGKNKKRFWLDTHNVVGITSLPFHILISVTVIVFAFHDLFYDSIGHLALKGQPVFHPPAREVIQPTRQDINLEEILYKVKQVAPEYDVKYIQFNNLNNPQKATARIALYSPNQLLRGANNDFMSMNPYAVDHFNSSGINTQTNAGNKLINAMFSLHFGSYGGDTVRWIYFILGIGGAFLFYSGNILWVETRARKQKRPQDPTPVQRKDVVFLANLTIGTCLGCILAIMGTLLASRWLYSIIQIESINHLFMYSYYTIFIAIILLTFYLGYAKALPKLLLSISLILFLIPLSSLCAYVLPQTGLWFHSGEILIIDVLAVIFGIAFLRFYQQAKDRTRIAPQGSLWAISQSLK
ncbi:PepSY-associated TM helix domain-containing protein [Acinetobacter guerrae]|uniref:PepSY-associated TM helix domain-containing protein n=1 Tax=Acinetobacter guerrae TaxID=1843371 RepID=UPI00125EDD7A|nr:PepSY-associated TM helix domain-containing protein [Acinetobacter guerrae]